MKKLKLAFIAIFAVFYLNNINVYATGLSPVLEPHPVMKGTYFTVKPDLRKCVSPICGGWFVTAVNQEVMSCPDGTIQKECYVGTDKITIPGLSDIEMADLRHSMSNLNTLLQGTVSNLVEYGLLLVNSAWIGATTQAPEGRFVAVSNNGIVCITYPCPSYDGHILNQKMVKNLASVDLSAVQANDEQLALAQKAINSHAGLPMAGHFIEVTGPAGSAQGIAASQFYLKVESKKPKMCMPTGCSGQICSATEVATTCEWRPEYACYRSATCSTQKNGDCGWVMDDELQQCLANSAINRLLQPGITK